MNLRLPSALRAGAVLALLLPAAALARAHAVPSVQAEPQRHAVIERIHELLDEAGQKGSVGKADEGRVLLQEVLDLWHSPQFPSGDPEAVETVRRIGRMADRLSLYDSAKEAWQLVVDRWSVERPFDDPDLDSVRVTFGLAARSKHDWATAREVIEGLLEARLRMYSEDTPEVLVVRNYLIDTLIQLQDYPAAREHLEVLYELQSALIPEGHEDLMKLRERLAFNRYRTGDLLGAAELFQAMLDVLRRTAAPDDDSLTGTRRNLTQVWMELGRFEAAAALQEETIVQYEALQGPGSARAMMTRQELAGTLFTVGELPRARRLLERVVASHEAAGDPNGPMLLDARLNLFELLAAMGDTDAAIEQGVQAHQGYSTYLAPEHPRRLLAVRLLATELLRAGRVAEAVKLLDGALSTPTTALPVGNEDRTRLSELREEARYLAGEREEPPAPAVRTRAALAMRVTSAARAGAADLPARLGELEAALLKDLTAGRGPSPGHARRVAAGAGADLALLLTLRAVPDGEPVAAAPLELLETARLLATRPSGDPTIDLAALAGALPEGGAYLALDEARLGVPGASDGAGRRVVVHLVTRDGAVRRWTRPVPLDEARAWRAALRDDDAGAEAEAREALRATLLDDIPFEGLRTLWLRPDGALAALPLDLLRPDGLEVRVVASAGELIGEPAASREAGLLAVGPAAEAASAALAEPEPAVLPVQPASVERLPAAARRARWLELALPAWNDPSGASTWRRLGSDGPAVLEPVIARELPPGCDPRDLVGLALGTPAGAADALGHLPGVLTARGLGALSLAGVDLVALPMFAPSDDPLRAGEQVAALVGALSGAGARCVVTAAWPVGEEAATAFLTALNERLGAGLTAVDAAREARAALRDAGRPSREWAAWLLYGA